MTRLSIAIMAHPSRVEYVRRLRRRLPRAVVVWDPEPDGPRSPWRTARLAWSAAEEDATHHLVIQEDAVPCKGFMRAAEAALAAQPDGPVSFFCNWLGFVIARAQQEASDKCLSWAVLPQYGWYPTVALALPREQALDLGRFIVDRPAAADDAVVAQWVMARRLRVLQTVPSLVDHDESAPSLMKTSPRFQDRGAACYAGASAAEIDWGRGP